MAFIYSNMQITIAAAAAEGVNEGCLHKRSQRMYVEIEQITENDVSGHLLVFQQNPCEIFMRQYVTMEDYPLTKCAWAFQERMLSRCTLYLANDQFYYECRHHFVIEDGICHGGRFLDIYSKPKGTVYTDSPDLQLWYQLLEEYTDRRLSMRSDKLPALAGLARIFKARINGEYVAGLWSNNLI